MNRPFRTFMGLFLISIGVGYTLFTPFGQISLLITMPHLILALGIWLCYEKK